LVVNSYDIPNSHLWKRELDIEKEGKEKKLMLLSYGHGEECYERHGQTGEQTPQ
jgi:hypothetical protein